MPPEEELKWQDLSLQDKWVLMNELEVNKNLTLSERAFYFLNLIGVDVSNLRCENVEPKIWAWQRRYS